ncbi:MAG: Unknown protein, partial [uncultured Sulfurovum sp.]
WTDYETHYFPFLSAFLENLLGKEPINKGVRLVIDGSQMGSKQTSKGSINARINSIFSFIYY